MYYPRLLEDKIKRVAQYFKIILLTGARQVGKSTLLKHVFPAYPHIVFDYHPIEIKCKSQVSRSDASGIDAFMETYPKETIPLALILHAGTECYYITDKILALPWHAICKIST